MIPTTMVVGEDKFINCNEQFDADKLAYIVGHPERFGIDIKPDAFEIANRYLHRSQDGNLPVIYRQKKSLGRYCAREKLSMQTLPRKIRNTIARDIYLDIDMVNAGPTILRAICMKYHIDCPILSKYCDHREEFLAELKISRELGKEIMIQMMNGGICDFAKIGIDSHDLWVFQSSELPNIQFNICSVNMNDDYRKFAERKKKAWMDEKTRRSFVSALIYNLESRILDCMYSYMGRPTNAVLVFDGLMVRKEDMKLTTAECEAEILAKTLIPMKIKIKPFNDCFDLSGCEVPKYIYPRLEYYMDFHNLINKNIYPEVIQRWANNAICVIERGGKHAFLTRNIRVDHMTHLDSISYIMVKAGDLYAALNVYCNVYNLDYDYETAQYFLANPKEKPKGDTKKKINRFTFDMLGASSDGYLGEMMKMRAIRSFSHVDFIPFLARLGEPAMHECKNIFTGFPLEKVKQTIEINFEESALFRHMRDEFCNGNIDELNHWLDFLADILQDPLHIKGTGHLFYSAQGMGKSAMAHWLSSLVGGEHFISFEKTDVYFSKDFNTDQANKLIKVFEEVSDKGAAFANHDRLKGDMTKTKERIEPKGIDPYQINHVARMVFNTNNDSALRVENSDRRLTLHRANNRYANNLDYFAPIWDEVRDVQFCKASFEYLAERKYDVKNVLKCFETTYKAEQKQINLNWGMKYVKDLCENGYRGIKRDGVIRSADLSIDFRAWCDTNYGDKKIGLASLKGQLRTLGIDEKRIRISGILTRVYEIEAKDIEAKFKTLLVSPNFELDIPSAEDEVILQCGIA